jgi:bla regulator protein BlaR1
MILEYLSPLANHLWQSTLVVAAAALLALLLRKNAARVRYCLWFTAALKFLIPFSLLMNIGHRFEWHTPSVIAERPISAVAEISMPFVVPPTTPTRASAPTVNPIPVILWSLWLCGFVVSVSLWVRSWWRIRTAVNVAWPLNIDLPIDAIPVRVMSSKEFVEPAIFGIVRPVLLLPDGIADTMRPGQFKAILIHELCHVRRRDNFTTAIYMIAETVFWFYPLVRWIGQRLIDERERACDEEVLRLGNEAMLYAEGILHVCKTYLDSPLRCASSVTGSNLKRRIRTILSDPIAGDLNFVKKLLLTATVVSAVAVPLVIGMVHASSARQTFEVASVKLNKSNDRRSHFNAVPAAGRLAITGMTVRSVIQGAYALQPFELVHDDNPVFNQRIDIEAKTERPVASAAQMQQMLQPLLAERFKLAVHREQREMNAFVLTVAAKDGRLGPKMKKSERPCDDLGTAVTVFVVAATPPPGEPSACGFTPSGVGRIVGVGLDIPTIIDLLSALGRPIVDQTGLRDRYDIDVTYSPTPFSAATLAQRGGTPMPGVDPNSPSLSNAIEDQLGFKLQPKKMPIRVLVIDHTEPLTAN